MSLRIGYSSSLGALVIRGKSRSLPTPGDRREVQTLCRRMLRVKEDLSGFHSVCSLSKVLAPFAEKRSGRLLRSPTVFEDVVKTICTTNCSWANTKRMLRAICDISGGCFPSPRQLVQLGGTRLRDIAPVGYRAAYIAEFAQRVMEHDLEPESWVDCPTSDATLEAIRSIRGVGEYALQNVLMLVGRYEFIPLDTEVRKWIRNTHFAGKHVSDGQLLDRYERYTPWQYLAYKFERIGLQDNYIN